MGLFINYVMYIDVRRDFSSWFGKNKLWFSRGGKDSKKSPKPPKRPTKALKPPLNTIFEI